MDDLKIAPTPSYAREAISAQMKAHFAAVGHPLEILEAGCGREWNIDLEGVEFRLTGIDLDAKALEYRTTVIKDLDVSIVGDLRDVELQKGFYDIVFSAFVLEHIKGAESVLDSMVDALKPGGLLILRVPDGKAVYAFLARLLPHWTHVMYKRLAGDDKLAGKPGHPPYRVVYDPIVSREGFHDYILRHNLKLIDEMGTNPHIDGMGKLGPVAKVGQRAIAGASFGHLSGTHSNLTLIMTKPESTPGVPGEETR